MKSCWTMFTTPAVVHLPMVKCHASLLAKLAQSGRGSVRWTFVERTVIHSAPAGPSRMTTPIEDRDLRRFVSRYSMAWTLSAWEAAMVDQERGRRCRLSG